MVLHATYVANIYGYPFVFVVNIPVGGVGHNDLSYLSTRWPRVVHMGWISIIADDFIYSCCVVEIDPDLQLGVLPLLYCTINYSSGFFELAFNQQWEKRGAYNLVQPVALPGGSAGNLEIFSR